MTRCYPEIQEIMHLIRDEILKSQRSPEEGILDDVDLRNLLKSSKRKTAELREKRIITYMKPEGKIYYRLSDILKYLDRHKVEAIPDSVDKYFKS